MLLFGGYRRGDANDPDTYVMSVAAVLSLYEPAVIMEATDPRTGISTHERFVTFMPNSGEVKAFCEGIRNRIARVAQLRALPKPDFNYERKRQHPANVFVPPDAPQFQAMMDRSAKSNQTEYRFDQDRAGIWVPLGWLDGSSPARSSVTETPESVRAKYGLSKEQWDAIKNAPPEPDFWRGARSPQ